MAGWFKALLTRDKIRFIGVLAVPLLAASCIYPLSFPPPVPRIVDGPDKESLRTAIHRSVAFLKKLPPELIVGVQPRRFTAAEVLDSLVAFDELLGRNDCPECWAQRLNERFELIPSSTDTASQDVLFTGYYQPVMDGSLDPTPVYRYPLYGKPDDLIVAERVTLSPVAKTERVIGRLDGEAFVPYYSRREIDDLGSLGGRGLEIAWLKDPVDLFFLHVQGSGVLRLPDGRRVGVGYAAQNGRPYRSIGKRLIDSGRILPEEMSMQRLRSYLREHPEEVNETFAYNESYVFFRFVEEPMGSLDVPVTAGRSIATDLGLFPKGALAFIQTQEPVIDDAGGLAGWRPFSRIVLNQDSGGAIRGSRRVDFFFGTGDQAAAAAGYMNSRGKLYFLVLRNSSASDDRN